MLVWRFSDLSLKPVTPLDHTEALHQQGHGHTLTLSPGPALELWVSSASLWPWHHSYGPGQLRRSCDKNSRMIPSLNVRLYSQCMMWNGKIQGRKLKEERINQSDWRKVAPRSTSFHKSMHLQSVKQQRSLLKYCEVPVPPRLILSEGHLSEWRNMAQ